MNQKIIKPGVVRRIAEKIADEGINIKLQIESRISSTDLWRKRVKFVTNTGYCRGAYRYR